MKQAKIEQAIKLLEQARALLQDHSNPNIQKSQSFLKETIRCLKESPE